MASVQRGIKNICKESKANGLKNYVTPICIEENRLPAFDDGNNKTCLLANVGRTLDNEQDSDSANNIAKRSKNNKQKSKEDGIVPTLKNVVRNFLCALTQKHVISQQPLVIKSQQLYNNMKNVPSTIQSCIRSLTVFPSTDVLIPVTNEKTLHIIEHPGNTVKSIPFSLIEEIKKQNVNVEEKYMTTKNSVLSQLMLISGRDQFLLATNNEAILDEELCVLLYSLFTKRKSYIDDSQDIKKDCRTPLLNVGNNCNVTNRIHKRNYTTNCTANRCNKNDNSKNCDKKKLSKVENIKDLRDNVDYEGLELNKNTVDKVIIESDEIKEYNTLICKGEKDHDEETSKYLKEIKNPLGWLHPLMMKSKINYNDGNKVINVLVKSFLSNPLESCDNNKTVRNTNTVSVFTVEGRHLHNDCSTINAVHDDKKSLSKHYPFCQHLSCNTCISLLSTSIMTKKIDEFYKEYSTSNMNASINLNNWQGVPNEVLHSALNNYLISEDNSADKNDTGSNKMYSMNLIENNELKKNLQIITPVVNKKKGKIDTNTNTEENLEINIKEKTQIVKCDSEKNNEQLSAINEEITKTIELQKSEDEKTIDSPTSQSKEVIPLNNNKKPDEITTFTAVISENLNQSYVKNFDEDVLWESINVDHQCTVNQSKLSYENIKTDTSFDKKQSPITKQNEPKNYFAYIQNTFNNTDYRQTTEIINDTEKYIPKETEPIISKSDDCKEKEYIKFEDNKKLLEAMLSKTNSQKAANIVSELVIYEEPKTQIEDMSIFSKTANYNTPMEVQTETLSQNYSKLNKFKTTDTTVHTVVPLLTSQSNTDLLVKDKYELVNFDVNNCSVFDVFFNKNVVNPFQFKPTVEKDFGIVLEKIPQDSLLQSKLDNQSTNNSEAVSEEIKKESIQLPEVKSEKEIVLAKTQIQNKDILSTQKYDKKMFQNLETDQMALETTKTNDSKKNKDKISEENHSNNTIIHLKKNKMVSRLPVPEKKLVTKVQEPEFKEEETQEDKEVKSNEKVIQVATSSIKNVKYSSVKDLRSTNIVGTTQFNKFKNNRVNAFDVKDNNNKNIVQTSETTQKGSVKKEKLELRELEISIKAKKNKYIEKSDALMNGERYGGSSKILKNIIKENENRIEKKHPFNLRKSESDMSININKGTVKTEKKGQKTESLTRLTNSPKKLVTLLKNETTTKQSQKFENYNPLLKQDLKGTSNKTPNKIYHKPQKLASLDEDAIKKDKDKKLGKKVESIFKVVEQNHFENEIKEKKKVNNMPEIEEPTTYKYFVKNEKNSSKNKNTGSKVRQHFHTKTTTKENVNNKTTKTSIASFNHQNFETAVEKVEKLKKKVTDFRSEDKSDDIRSYNRNMESSFGGFSGLKSKSAGDENQVLDRNNNAKSKTAIKLQRSSMDPNNVTMSKPKSGFSGDFKSTMGNKNEMKTDLYNNAKSKSAIKLRIDNLDINDSTPVNKTTANKSTAGLIGGFKSFTFKEDSDETENSKVNKHVFNKRIQLKYPKTKNTFKNNNNTNYFRNDSEKNTGNESHSTTSFTHNTKANFVQKPTQNNTQVNQSAFQNSWNHNTRDAESVSSRFMANKVETPVTIRDRSQDLQKKEDELDIMNKMLEPALKKNEFVKSTPIEKNRNLQNNFNRFNDKNVNNGEHNLDSRGKNSLDEIVSSSVSLLNSKKLTKSVSYTSVKSLSTNSETNATNNTNYDALNTGMSIAHGKQLTPNDVTNKPAGNVVDNFINNLKNTTYRFLSSTNLMTKKNDTEKEKQDKTNSKFNLSYNSVRIEQENKSENIENLTEPEEITKKGNTEKDSSINTNVNQNFHLSKDENQHGIKEEKKVLNNNLTSNASSSVDFLSKNSGAGVNKNTTKNLFNISNDIAKTPGMEVKDINKNQLENPSKAKTTNDLKSTEALTGRQRNTDNLDENNYKKTNNHDSKSDLRQASFFQTQQKTTYSNFKGLHKNAEQKVENTSKNVLAGTKPESSYLNSEPKTFKVTKDRINFYMNEKNEHQIQQKNFEHSVTKSHPEFRTKNMTKLYESYNDYRQNANLKRAGGFSQTRSKNSLSASFQTDSHKSSSLKTILQRKLSTYSGFDHNQKYRDLTKGILPLNYFRKDRVKEIKLIAMESKLLRRTTKVSMERKFNVGFNDNLYNNNGKVNENIMKGIRAYLQNKGNPIQQNRYAYKTTKKT